jgi:hypothetical protein
VPSASSQPAILSLDFDTCVYYLYVMTDQNESLVAYQGISEEVRLALKLVGIKFWGYRQDHMMYQFTDIVIWRNWYVDPEHMNDETIKIMMDGMLANRAGSAAKSL